MAMRKPIILMLSIVTLATSVAIVMYYQAQRFDPCQRLSRTELANIYLPLAELLEQQKLENNQLLSQQRDQDFMMNIEMTGAEVSPEEALIASTEQIEAVAALRRRHSEEFDELCSQLVDR